MINRRALLLSALPAFAAVRQEKGNWSGRLWTSDPPGGCPLERSTLIKVVQFTGRWVSYANADTWYPSWGADGKLYSPWTDGHVGDLNSNSYGPDANTGFATILGDSPLALQIVDTGTVKASPAPYGGRYPCGSLVHRGVWYYGTYCLADTDGNPAKGLNWDILGPFVGFRTSRDYGRTWQETPHTPAKPLFGEPERLGAPVKIGAPHFVDFGRDMQHSPDGRAYLVAHGATSADRTPRPANLSWITGDQIYLTRFEPSAANANDPAKYEFFGGRDGAGKPRWTRSLTQARPIIDWDDHAGCVTATYIPALKRFILCATDGGNTISRFGTWFAESESLTGPWRLIAYLRDFGQQAYFVNIPSKFVSADGRSAWLMYAANFTNGYLKTNFKADPPGSGYGMCLQEIKFV